MIENFDTPAHRRHITRMSETPAFTTPLRLRPLYMERVWGGRMLHSLYGRPLPDGGPIGESWEVVDRADEQSTVCGGILDGHTLHSLWENHRAEVFGPAAPDTERFPLLIKILDARDRLSIQVHPPAEIAKELGGEPKTEMWYIAHAEENAALYIGVQPGTGREAFARAIADGTVEQCVHRIPVQAGEFIFVPSGRLHAIGGGLVIFEIQQNSDTTYRVFDWNRMGLDGQPRALHVEQSLECIDFTDTAPGMGTANGSLLVDCPHFIVERIQLVADTSMKLGRAGEFCLLTLISGDAALNGEPLQPGEFLLLPACLTARERGLRTEKGATLLKTAFGGTRSLAAV
jgi:mannose-6-phosphate isomerase